MDASCNILQPILIIFAGLCCIIILISKFLFRLSVNPSEFSSWLQWNFSAVLYNYMYFMVSLIDEAYIHPGLSDLHDEAAGNEIRPEWFWKQLSNLSNAIIKVVIDEARWWNSYSTLHWEPYSGLCIIFFLFEKSLFQEVNILVDVNYHALVWTCGYLPEYETQYWHSYQFFKNTKWSGVSQTNYYDIWNANI